MRARWFMLCMRKNAVPFTPKDKVAKLSRFFGQRVTKLLPRNRYGHWARSICHSFGNSVVPAQANSALVTLMKVLNTPTTTLEAARFSKIDRWKPTVAVSPTSYYQDKSYKVPSTECQGRGFTVVPPKPLKNYESKMTLPMLTKPFKSICSPTPCTSGCSIPLPTMSRRTRSMAGNFLLSAKELWSGKMPGHHTKRMQTMVSDEFWAASMGFPKKWIRPVLRA